MLPSYRIETASRVTPTGLKRVEINVPVKITCTNANQVYGIGAIVATVGGSDLIDGTNILAHTELIISLNDASTKGVPATGTAAVPHVTLLRTNSADGTATSALATADKTIIDIFGMDASSVVRYPLFMSESVKKFAIACDTAGITFQVSLKGYYYTP